MDVVLVINAGSSSIKFAVYSVASFPQPQALIGRGHVAQVGDQLELLVKLSAVAIGAVAAGGKPTERSQSPLAHGLFNHDTAMARMFAWLDAHQAGLRLVAVGHRVVHGGSQYSAAVRVTAEVLRDLTALIPLAPLHQPHNLQAIRAVSQRWPNVPQVACFDTAFHAHQAPVAQAYALPRELSAAGLRRYGFHGLSYEYIADQLPRVLGDASQGRVIVAHLGNGASLCALKAGQSVASTMGFSALDGLMMGSRCGALDPGVVLYLLEEMHLTVPQVSDLLYRRSGLLGVSGLSSDMQVLLDSPDPHAAEAVALFVHRIVVEIGALAAALGGLDALVFSAGIGEHAAPIRARVCEGCAWLGVVLDDVANLRADALIHAPASRVQVAVLPTDEEQMIASHTLRDVGLKRY